MPKFDFIDQPRCSDGLPVMQVMRRLPKPDFMRHSVARLQD
ncbi:MAG: hypothetical protein ACPG07_05020 [Henriciella sp.]